MLAEARWSSDRPSPETSVTVLAIVHGPLCYQQLVDIGRNDPRPGVVLHDAPEASIAYAYSDLPGAGNCLNIGRICAADF